MAIGERSNEYVYIDIHVPYRPDGRHRFTLPPYPHTSTALHPLIRPLACDRLLSNWRRNHISAAGSLSFYVFYATATASLLVYNSPLVPLAPRFAIACPVCLDRYTHSWHAIQCSDGHSQSLILCWGRKSGYIGDGTLRRRMLGDDGPLLVRL